MRTFLATTKGLIQAEAIPLMSVAVDFGVIQVVDGNWGVHAIIRKAWFTAELICDAFGLALVGVVRAQRSSLFMEF
jgi:acetamidase/formamidase